MLLLCLAVCTSTASLSATTVGSFLVANNDVPQTHPPTAGGSFLAAASDSGAANGIGLAANSNYLYAAFSSSSTIATFAIQSGCVLAFVGDVFTIGLQGGLVGGMAGAGVWA
jgi:hypothetical protein